ncbi:MAG TPA: hypothetical protein DCW31_06075 [Lactobacillus sp.]|nr:hypothetical protein [Lactobacillus sp.]
MAKVTVEEVADHLRQTLGHVATSENTLLLTRTASHIGAYQLSLTQLQILRFILQSDDAVTNSLLADTFAISKPAVTKALRKLSKELLVDTHTSETDRRVTTLALTSDGMTLAREYQEIDREINDTYLGIAQKFSKGDRKTILKFLETVEGTLQQGLPF